MHIVKKKERKNLGHGEHRFYFSFCPGPPVSAMSNEKSETIFLQITKVVNSQQQIAKHNIVLVKVIHFIATAVQERIIDSLVSDRFCFSDYATFKKFK